MSDPQMPPSPELPAAIGGPLAPPEEPRGPRGLQRLLLLIAAGLAGFIGLVCVGLVLFVTLTPAVRARLPFAPSGPPPEGPAKFAEQAAGPVRISDDFTIPGERWDRSQTRVVDGAYELTLELDNFDSYGLFLGPGAIRDFDMAVDAALVAGDPNAEFGIRFRQSAPDDHLLFSISGTGYYRLARVKDEQYTSLVPWTKDERIRTGPGDINRLRLVAEGPTIRGFVNGEQVLEHSDQDQAAGQLTLGLVTFNSGDVRVRFDNVEGFALVQPPLADAQPERVDLAEDFADPAGVPWSVGGATVKGGSYEVFVGGTVQSWQQPLPTGSSRVEGDFVLEVEATMVSGDLAESAYGLMFGDGGRFNFFTLYLLPEGGIMMLRNGPDGGILIEPQPLEIVNPGLGATNSLRMEVRGREMLLTINDRQLNPIPLPDGITFDGMAGMAVQSGSPAGVTVRFDNFTLEELGE